MLSSLPARDGSWCGFAVVHLLRYAFPGPGGFYTWIQIHDVQCALADFVVIEDDVVVVEVEDKGDVEFFADREKVMDRVADIVIFEDKSPLDVFIQLGVVLAKAL